MSRIAGLAEWLAHEAAANPPVAVLHDHWCREVLGRGLPIWRSSLGLEMLHPEVSGSLFVWTAGALAESVYAREGIATNASYLDSPMRIVDETGRPFRRRLDQPAPELPLLEELREQGATDYVLLPLPFADRHRSAAVSFATAAADGFSAADLGDLETAAALFSPYAERVVLRRIAIDLLDVYIGRSAGEKVFDGHIGRGDAETLFAAIWFCDLRGFTAFSDAAPRDAVVSTLNAWFDAMAGAVVEHGGEVLKFLGDGMLAIFPAVPDATDACDRALAAAREAAARIAALNAERHGAGLPALAFGLALHLGEVSYGNVGSSRRLDFTVIGPAVNHASRLQELTKTLGHPVLASGPFAKATRQRLTPLGRHALRDVADAIAVFAG